MLLNTIRIFHRYSQAINVSRCTSVNNCQINVIRFYAGKFSREPVAIVNEDELFEVEDDDRLKRKILRKEHRQRMKEKKRNKKEPTATTETPEVIDKKMFTQLHENEKYLTPIIFNAKTYIKNKKSHKIVLEGFRLMTEAIQAGVIPEIVIYSSNEWIDKLSVLKDTDTLFYKVPYKTIQLWSSVTTSPGVMGIFPVPEINKEEPEYAIPLTIICDNVRDPGNLGSILRTAAAVGCEKILLSKGCVDIWNPKVVRSAAGAHFKLPIHSALTWTEIKESIPANVELFAADNYNLFDDDHQLVSENEKESPDALDNEECEAENAKAKIKTVTTGYRARLETMKKEIRSVPYYDVNYTMSDSVLIIGGETEGLGEDVLSLLKSRNGTRINIPLYNNVESLNTGMSLGIIAYEINRQHTFKMEEVDSKEEENEKK